MDDAVRAVLDEYHARDAREAPLRAELRRTGQFEGRRDEFLLSVGAEAAQFLNLLAKACRAKVIVEVGASYGYSTVWLAEAARANGGTLYSLEIVPAKVEYARARLRQAGLERSVEFMVGDAVGSLARFPQPIGFALIDLWKDLYVPVLEALHPRLAPGALVAADNILYPAEYAGLSAAYRDSVRARGLQSVTVPIGHGSELSRVPEPSGTGGARAAPKPAPRL